ncbi:Uncharacterised protein [Vibrio cholerae]|nr:Uncharacterised protein [Vibrio cholerae]
MSCILDSQARIRGSDTVAAHHWSSQYVHDQTP